MDHSQADLLANLLSNMTSRSNRTLEDLKTSTDMLSGADAQTLRTFTSEALLDLEHGFSDPCGLLLQRGSVDSFKVYFDGRTAVLDSKAAAVKEIEDKPRYLIDEAKVPVDGVDMAGNSAMMYAISARPYVKPDYAQMLFDASANINFRNRFGCTAAHDIVQCYQFDVQTKTNHANMLRWFIEHGGDLNIADGDGMKARDIANMMTQAVPEFGDVLSTARATEAPKNEKPKDTDKGDSRTNPSMICYQCLIKAAKGTPSPQRCARCKSAYYCSRNCQKLAWKSHKSTCSPSSTPDIDLVPGVRLPCAREPGKLWSSLIPSNHPIFDSSPLHVPCLIDIPLVIHRVGTQSANQADLDCQIATYLNIDPETGFASPEWLSHVGTCVVARKDRKPLSVEHLELVWMYMDKILDYFGEEDVTGVRKFYTRKSFEKFEKGYKRDMMQNQDHKWKDVGSIYDV